MLALCRQGSRALSDRSVASIPWVRRLATTAPGLKINPDRLWNDLHHTCQWGTGVRWGDQEHETGMQRLALSAEDKLARDWFVDTTRSLGCKVTIDALGNIFAVRPGKNDGKPVVAASHLDTQPTGGRYDGILGVHAGIEMLKTLQDSKIETNYPIGVVNWTNEEGARFPASMVSSGVWAGAYNTEYAHNLAEVGEGKRTMKEELQKIGYLGDLPAHHEVFPLAAHFELHIEQGPILEGEKRKIGIVTGAQAYEWNYCEIKGQESHSGTTAWEYRRDPMQAAAKTIVGSGAIAKRNRGLATTGILSVSPGSINTIPGTVRFSLDVRHSKTISLDRIMAEVERQMEAFAKKYKCQASIELATRSEAVQFQEEAVSCVRRACKNHFGKETASLTKEMQSGAGHDSVYASRHTPTAMIFVPCRHGISHNPKEHCEKEDCAIGAQILMDSVLIYDQERTQ